MRPRCPTSRRRSGACSSRSAARWRARGAVASNREIADELVVAVDTVKGTLSRLFEQFGIGGDVPQNQKRALLARRALQAGVVGKDELDQ